MTLAEMVAECEKLDSVIRFDKEIAAFDWSRRPEVPGWMTDANSKYLRMLSAWCRIFEVNRVLEIGTGYGSSALAMAQHAKEVITVDIRHEQVPDRRILTGKIRPYLLSQPDECWRVDFSGANFIYVDIGDHDGKYEELLHKRFCREYVGVVAYDDINWSGMKPFWDSISEEKIATNWHRDSGFGLVKYGVKE